MKRIMHGVMQINFAPNSTVTRAVRGIAHYMDAIIYHRKYKFWRNLQAELREQNMRKRPYVDVSVQPPSGSLYRSEDPVRTVQFRTQSNDSTDSVQSATGTSNGASLSSRKKGPAPSPPISSARGKVITYDSRSYSTVTKVEHQVSRSQCCSPKWTNLCAVCVASNQKRSEAEQVQLRDAKMKKKKTTSSESDPGSGEQAPSGMHFFNPHLVLKVFH